MSQGSPGMESGAVSRLKNSNMQHFFVEEHQLSNDVITVLDSDAHHIKNVLRLRPGEEVSFSVRGREGVEFRCEIGECGEDYVLCPVIFTKENNVELPCRVTLFQGLPKGDKMETVIQKTVELGVASIVPVAMARSVVRLDEKKAAKKTERWQGIAEAAAKQSQRGLIPEVLTPRSFDEAVTMCAGCDLILVPYEKADDMKRTRELIGGIEPGRSVAVFIGPEGGFTDGEIAELKAAGAREITLGRRILRTETAGMTVMSFLVYALEN